MILCGALAACTMGTFTSCSDDDDRSSYDEYLDTKINEINKALASNLSIVSVTSEGGSYVLTLSDGSKISTGADIDVTVEANCIKLTVGGKVYEIPKSGGGSLQFAPEYADGEVRIGDASGATVMFIPNPALTSLAGVEPSVAVAYELKTRSADQFKVTFDEINSDGMIVGKLYCLDQDLAGNTMGVSVQMDNNGTVLGSDVFTVKIADDFSFSSEEIDPSIVPVSADAVKNDDGSYSLPAISGGSLGTGISLAEMFSGLPDGAYFKAASSSKQPNEKAREKASIIAKSVGKNGVFKWAGRPGTAFNEDQENPGFLILINNASETTVAKFYITVNDELADTDFNVLPSGGEMEWGGTVAECALPLGAQRIKFQDGLADWETTFPSQDKIFSGMDLLQQWNDLAVKTPAGKTVCAVLGGEWGLADLGEEYAPAETCRGVAFFHRGLNIMVPAPLADSGYVWEPTIPTDQWFDSPEDWARRSEEDFYRYSSGESLHYLTGIRVDSKTGDIILPAEYSGYGFRIAMGIVFEYLYGEKRISSPGNDMLAMFFFNRNICPDEASMDGIKSSY